MKKTIALMLSVIMLVSALVLPVNMVSAAEPDYLDYYSFSFAQDDIYSYVHPVKGQEGSSQLSVNPLGGGSSVAIQPFYPYVNYANNWGGNSIGYKSVDGVDTMEIVTGNQVVIVPVKEDGQPLELAPGHTYTVTISYTLKDVHSSGAIGDSWYAQKAFLVGGGVLAGTQMNIDYRGTYSSITAFGDGSYLSRPYCAVIDDLKAITSGGTKTLTFTTPAANGDGYTYNAQQNAYEVQVKGSANSSETFDATLYNYFFLALDRNDPTIINISKLEVVRDDYVPPVEDVDWDEVLEDKYVFDFTNEAYYADRALKSGQTLYDGTLPWHIGAIAFDAKYGRGTRSVYPNYSLVSTYDWGPQIWSKPGKVEYQGKTYSTLNVYRQHEGYFVPLKEDGTPLELAPGHKYTLKYKYYVNYVAEGKTPYLAADIGLSSTGVIEYNYEGLNNKVAYSDNRFGWLNGNVGTIQEGTLTISTENQLSDANYSKGTNTYNLTVGNNNYTLYNYLYFAITSGNAGIDFISLEVTRDDYREPIQEVNWDEESPDYYNFDLSKQGNYTDITTGNKLDTSLSYTTVPLTVDAGYGRGERKIFPVYSSMTAASLQHNWGTQIYTNKNTINVDGKDVATAKFWTGTNPAYYMPLKDDGTPLELAPGHTYTVNVSFRLDALSKESDNPQLQVNVGAVSTGAVKNAFISDTHRVYSNKLCYSTQTLASYNASSVGQIIEGSVQIRTPEVSDKNYDSLNNTYKLTYEDTEYTLYNYLYFYFNSWQGPTIDFISIEVVRDDYVPEMEPVDWDEALDDHYKFDFSPEYVGYMTDKQDEGNYDRLDNSKTWTASPVKFDSGYGRGNRNVYASWSYSSTNPWGPQIFSWPENISYNGIFTDTMAIYNENPGIFVPLTEEGKPFELAPGHSYEVKIVVQKNNFNGTGDYGDNNLKAVAGTMSSGAPLKNVWLDADKLVNLSVVKGSEGEILEGTATITVPGADSESYDEIFNTYTITVDGTEYVINNYFAIEYSGYAKAHLNIISLEITRDDYVRVDYTDTYLVSDSVENNSTYKIDFEYKIKGNLSKGSGLSFKYTKNDGNFVTYVEGKNKVIYKFSADKELDIWHTGTVLLTTDMYALVEDSIGYDDELIAVSNVLYAFIKDEDDAANIEIKNFNVKKLTDKADNDLINVMGASCLTDAAEQAAGCQALRYMFTYDTKTGAEICIDGTDYTVKERGFIYANGNLYAKGGVYKGDVNLTNAKAGKFLTNGVNTNLDKCWDYSEIQGTDYYSLVFSTYATDFELEDSKELLVKAYLVVEIDGQEFTIYSDAINRSVEYLKSNI